MRADSGPIGGEMSYEFHVLAETGESAVFLHADLRQQADPPVDIDFRQDLTPIFEDWTSLYAATDEMLDEARFKADVPADKQLSVRGIEVGHIFYFGTKVLRADEKPASPAPTARKSRSIWAATALARHGSCRRSRGQP